MRPYNKAYERLLRVAETDDPVVGLAHYNIGAMHVYMIAYHLRLDGNINDEIVKSKLKAAKQQYALGLAADKEQLTFFGPPGANVMKQVLGLMTFLV